MVRGKVFSPDQGRQLVAFAPGGNQALGFKSSSPSGATRCAVLNPPHPHPAQTTEVLATLPERYSQNPSVRTAPNLTPNCAKMTRIDLYILRIALVKLPGPKEFDPVRHPYAIKLLMPVSAQCCREANRKSPQRSPKSLPIGDLQKLLVCQCSWDSMISCFSNKLTYNAKIRSPKICRFAPADLVMT